jgi:hypothetical protein
VLVIQGKGKRQESMAWIADVGIANDEGIDRIRPGGIWVEKIWWYNVDMDRDMDPE